MKFAPGKSGNPHLAPTPKVHFPIANVLVTIRPQVSQNRERMWRKLFIAGLSAYLLLAVLLLVHWDSVQVGYYKWQIKSAGEAASEPGASGRGAGWFPGMGDAQTRYSRARQALLDLGYLQELVLRFPVGSNWNALVQRCRERFPDGCWDLRFDQSRSVVQLTVPTEQAATWKGLVSEFSAP